MWNLWLIISFPKHFWKSNHLTMPNGNERATIDSFFFKFQNNLVTSWLLIFLHQIDFMFSLFHIFFSSPWFYLCIKRKTKNQMETWNSKINVSTFFLFSNAYLIIIVYRLFFFIFYLLLTFPFWCLPSFLYAPSHMTCLCLLFEANTFTEFLSWKRKTKWTRISSLIRWILGIPYRHI